jgi:hypothetical protein
LAGKAFSARISMKRRRKRSKAQIEQWSKRQAGRLLVKRVKKVPLSEYHGKGRGSNPNSWKVGPGRASDRSADREVAECNAVIDGDERRPAAMICEEKVHVITVDEFIHVRDNLFWGTTPGLKHRMCLRLQWRLRGDCCLLRTHQTSSCATLHATRTSLTSPASSSPPSSVTPHTSSQPRANGYLLCLSRRSALT